MKTDFSAAHVFDTQSFRTDGDELMARGGAGAFAGSTAQTIAQGETGHLVDGRTPAQGRMIGVDGLNDLAKDQARHRVAIADIMAAMGDGGVMMLILLFALPNAVPAPPGTSAVLGLPLLFLTLQWSLGKKPWVPGWIARRSLRRSEFAAIVKRLTSFSSWAEGISHPKLRAFASDRMLRLAGVAGVVLSVVLVLPLPLVNVPSGIALVLLSLGGLLGDGMLLILGFVSSAVSLAVALGVGWGIWRIGGQLLAHWHF